MARKRASVEYNDFTNGFITEASPLTFPENASIDEENMNINRDGSRQRRFGLSWDDSASTISDSVLLATSGEATSNYLWKSAGNDGTRNLGVIQKGLKLYFFDVEDANVSGALVATFTVSTILDNPDRTTPFDFTSAYGKLLVATGGTLIQVLDWDGSSITNTSFQLKFRDLFGIADTDPVDQRLTTGAIGNRKRYNLLNQGFPVTMLCAGASDGTLAPTVTNPIDYTFTKMSFYPSNADVVHASRLGAINTTGGLVDNIDAYSPWELEKNIFGTTPAPKGHYILDIFLRGSSRMLASGLTGLPTDSTTGGVSTIASFAGRVWGSVTTTNTTTTDENSPNLGNMVFYSQASPDEGRWGSCYTRNDQTAETFNDVLESDGGFILIPESGEIYQILPLGESLFIVTSNGVWEVFGGDAGFSATAQSVVKITDIGAVSRNPIILGDNIITYWAESGIYSVILDQSSLRGVVKNVTEDSIQTYYDDIPLNFKKEAVGAYDPISRKASWMYNLTAKPSAFYFDKELVLDVNKLSYTKRSFPTVDKPNGFTYPTTYLRLRNLLEGVQVEDVTDGGFTVTDGGVDVTVTLSNAEQKTKTSLMYWLSDNDTATEDFRLGGFIDFDFIDYSKVPNTTSGFGIDASAFLLTGYLTGGDGARTKYMPYITVMSKRTESDYSEDLNGDITLIGESSCLMQTQWEWTNDTLSGKWSGFQQVYRLPRFFALDNTHNFSFDVVRTRNKVRGSGKAVSIHFKTEPLKDMYLLGWGVDIEVNEQV